jgi:hypothetical protein
MAEKLVEDPVHVVQVRSAGAGAGAGAAHHHVVSERTQALARRVAEVKVRACVLSVYVIVRGARGVSALLCAPRLSWQAQRLTCGEWICKSMSVLTTVPTLFLAGLTTVAANQSVAVFRFGKLDVGRRSRCRLRVCAAKRLGPMLSRCLPASVCSAC